MSNITRGTTVYDRLGRRAEYECATADGRHVVYRVVGEDDDGEPIYDDVPEIWPDALTSRPAKIEAPGEREARERLAEVQRQLAEAHAAVSTARTELRVIEEARKIDAGIDEIIRWRAGELPWFAEREGRFRIFQPAPGALIEAVMRHGQSRKPPEWSFRSPGDDSWSSATPGRVFASREDALAWLASEVAAGLNDHALTRLTEAHADLLLDDVQRARLAAAREKSARHRLACHRRDAAINAANAAKAEQELRDLGVEP